MPNTPKNPRSPRSQPPSSPRKAKRRDGLPLRVREPDVPFADRVRSLVRRIPTGKVIAYGGVAALLGAPRAARGVGHVLSALPEGSNVPWWRVVNARGGISLHGYPGMLQRLMLESEGVRFGRSGLIDWREFGWRGDPS